MPIGDGCLLSWVSQENEVYTVLYTDTLTDSTWKPLAGFVNMPGTGQNLKVPDMAPKDSTRFYKIHMGPYPEAP